jgi:hypothetical protein
MGLARNMETRFSSCEKISPAITRQSITDAVKKECREQEGRRSNREMGSRQELSWVAVRATLKVAAKGVMVGETKMIARR